MSFLFACGMVIILTSVVRAQTTQQAGPAPGLQPTSYTYVYTVTTATTNWAQPTFQPSGPSVPDCSDTMCPDIDNKICKDAAGNSYGILCDTRFIGQIISNAGKEKKKEKRVDEAEVERDSEEAAALYAAGSLGERDAVAVALEADGSVEARGDLHARIYTRTFEGCADSCDQVAGCVGMSFNAGFEGNCQSLSVIEGSFEAVGEVAAVKQSV